MQRLCDGCASHKNGWCQAKREFVARGGVYECDQFIQRRLDPGCRSCQSLFDGRYCIHWRDIIPDDVFREGCAEIDQYPPF